MYFEHIGESARPATSFAHRAPIIGKRAFDLLVATFGLIVMGVFAVVLFVLNPLLNPGPLFFRQERMGQNGEPFMMWKFRTMSVCTEGKSARPALAPLEADRITPFAALLRRYRIDELPNFINVFKGEMSVIGPRPDAWDHAVLFSDTVPYYRNRFRVQPGITGLAQVRGGYAECSDATRRKARFDHVYIRKSGWRMELYIVWKTLQVLMTGFGAK